jgi:hypothetical protein
LQKHENKPDAKPLWKKPRDPLQGMREAGKEKLMRQAALKVAAAEKAAPPKTTPPPGKRKETADETPKPRPETKSVFEEPDTSKAEAETLPRPGSSAGPVPLSSTAEWYKNSRNGRTQQRWMLYTIAVILFGAGAVRLFIASPGPPVREDLSESDPVVSTPASPNVSNAIKILKEAFEERCSTDEHDLEKFSGESRTGVGKGIRPRAIVWPESTDEVRVILKVADSYRVPVVPYSAGTSIEGYTAC